MRQSPRQLNRSFAPLPSCLARRVRAAGAGALGCRVAVRDRRHDRAAMRQFYVVFSLPNFRLVRSRSLSLGAQVSKNLARRSWPARAAWAVQQLLAARW